MHRPVEAPAGGVVIEWAPFRLRDGVSEGELLAAADAIQRDFLGSQPGFLKRELARGADGRWVDVVHWTDAAAAEAAMDAAATSVACNSYFEIMVGANGGADPGEGLMVMQLLRSY